VTGHLEASEGFLDRRVVGEYSIERGELEHHTNLLVGSGEPELALAASHLLERRDHRTEASAVDEADAFHVDDDVLGAVLYNFGYSLFQRRRAGHVKTARGCDHGGTAVGFARLDLEGQLRTPMGTIESRGQSRHLAPLHCKAVAVPGSSERILVVDDEEALAKVMARTLRSRGFESDTALTAAQARQLFESQDYALALLDVRLPDESGYGLLEELKARRPDTAVVMVSGVDDPELGKAAMEQGVAAGKFNKTKPATNGAGR